MANMRSWFPSYTNRQISRRKFLSGAAAGAGAAALIACGGGSDEPQRLTIDPSGVRVPGAVVYGSDEWKKGPREPILALIENYSTISIWLDEATVRGLRAAGERQLALPADAPARAEFPASGNR